MSCVPPRVMSRNSVCSNSAADSFSSTHAICQCELISVKKVPNAPAGNHTDAFQILSSGMPDTGHDNYIIYRLKGLTDVDVQFFFIKDSALKNASFSECEYTPATPTLPEIQFSQVMTNCLFHKITMPTIYKRWFRYDWRLAMTDVLISESPDLAFANWDVFESYVTAVQQGAQTIVTHPRHIFSTGYTVSYSGIDGMTQLNSGTYKVIVIDASTYELRNLDDSPLDSTAFTPFTTPANYTNSSNIVLPTGLLLPGLSYRS